MRLIAGAAAAAIAALAAAAPAAADWREPIEAASPINFESGRGAGDVSLTAVGGRPTMAWQEDNTAPGAGNSSVIRVAQLDPSRGTWQPLAGDISRVPTASSFQPSVADVDGEPWVAWAENLDSPLAQIRVARPSPGGGWERVDDRDRPINQTAGPDDLSHANNPVIVDGGDGRPYVAFWEFVLGGGSVIDPSGMAAPAAVWVVRLNTAGHWAAVGGGPTNPPATPPAESGIKDATMPDIAVVGGRVWVTYLQLVKPEQGDPTPILRAARLNAAGNAWEQVEPLSVPDGFQLDFKSPDIAAVGGAPMVAAGLVPTGSQGGGRVFVARPRADLSGWDPVGGGFASPEGARSPQPSLAEAGNTAWLAWDANGSGSAARLADGAWVPSGGPIRNARDGFNGPPRLAAVGGLPWVGFTADDGTQPGQPGQRGCCTQARAARLVPDFGTPTVYPAPTTAAVLGAVDTFGLSYPLGLETTAQGGSPVDSVFTPLNAAQALGELRALKPGTVHSVRAYATAGTSAKAYGPATQFVTPPAGELAATSLPATSLPATSLPATPVVAAGARGVPLLGILHAPERVRRGRTVRLTLFSSEAGRAEFVITRKGKTVRHVVRTVPAGRWALTWKARVARGGYRLKVTLRTPDGRLARDAMTLRIVR